MGGMTSGHTGCLFVTTLRLSLQLHTAASKERGNKLLGEQDVTLSSIEAVYEVLYINNIFDKYIWQLYLTTISTTISTTPTRCRARLVIEKTEGREGKNWPLALLSPIGLFFIFLLAICFYWLGQAKSLLPIGTAADEKHSTTLSPNLQGWGHFCSLQEL